MNSILWFINNNIFYEPSDTRVDGTISVNDTKIIISDSYQMFMYKDDLVLI